MQNSEVEMPVLLIEGVDRAGGYVLGDGETNELKSR